MDLGVCSRERTHEVEVALFGCHRKGQTLAEYGQSEGFSPDKNLRERKSVSARRSVRAPLRRERGQYRAPVALVLL